MTNERSGAVQITWDKAVRIFNTSLTKDPRKIIQSSDISTRKHSCSLFELVIATQEAHRQCYSKNIPGAANFKRVLQAVDKYALVADVLIQHQPHTTAIVWGCIRFLIQVSVAEIELGEEVGAALQTILTQIGRYELEAQLFFDEPRVLDSIAVLFAHIINYLVRANCHFSHTNLIRAARAAFSSKFSKLAVAIERCALNLDRDITTASSARLVRSNQAAETEFVKQEAFRKECRAALRGIDALDPKEDITGDAQDLKNMLDNLSSCFRWQRRAQGYQEKLGRATKWLRDGAPREDVVSQREPGTCEWILNHEGYQSWLETEHKHCLWIHGIPGSGKSVLSSFLIEKASTSSEIVLSYSFHSSLDHRSAQVSPFVLSLLLQLCRNRTVTSDPHFRPTLEKITSLPSHSKYSLDCPLKVLLAILENVLEWLPAFVLIVDGLDDCVEPDDSFKITKYVHKLGMSRNSQVVVLSRASARFEAVFPNVTQISMDCVEIERDIEFYLYRRISRAPKLFKLKDEIMAKAYEDGRGMFLWAKLMLDGLQQCLGTIRTIRERLLRTPVELFDLYEQQSELVCLQLCPQARAKRGDILLLLFGLNQPLSVRGISAALALDTGTDLNEEEDELIEPAIEIEKLCRPLVKVVGDVAQFVHVTVKEFLLERKMSREDSNLFLARKSLSKLSQAQYKDWKYAAGLLRKNLLAGSVIGGPLERSFEESVFYNYACLHWHEHVTALSDPPGDILAKLSSFLTGAEFVTWSEVLFDLKGRAGLGPLIQVRVALLAWYQVLAPPVMNRVPMDDFFILPHELLSTELHQKSEDKLLPYLPLLRLGAYFNLGGQSSADWQKAYDYKRAVAGGFEDLLGARNPFTLRAKTSMLQEFFWQKRFPEAEEGLREVANIQQEVLGDQVLDYWVTLQLLGLAQFSLTSFEEAQRTLRQTEKGLLELLGSSHILLLMTGLYKGYVLERLAELEQAAQLYDDIWHKSAPVMGQFHPFSLMLQTAIGSVARKRKQFDVAQESLLEAWAARQRIFTINANLSVDSAIQLALTYREIGCRGDAVEILNVISESQVFETDFERHCQITHIRALLDLDAGLYEKPRLALEKLLDSDRDSNNRELLWVRIDLADILREHGECDEALMLFTELVEPAPRQQSNSPEAEDPPTPSSLSDEPEPAERLKIAEEALRLVRAATPKAAEELLLLHGLRWVRQEDFWILQGGPITDTA